MDHADVMFPLAFLSYYRYSFFLTDFIVFLLVCLVYHHLTYKISPVFIPEEKKTKFEWIRKIISLLLGIQLLCYIVMTPIIFFNKPLFVHLNTETGFLGFVFVLMVVFRLINIMFIISFIVCCWDNNVQQQRWSFLLMVLLSYYLYMLFYILFPTMNRALGVYEMFYNIRNLHIINDPKKKYKTFQYLQQSNCIPDVYMPLYEYEWSRTFKNNIKPMRCP